MALVARDLAQEDPLIRMQRDARGIGCHPPASVSLGNPEYWLRSTWENPPQAPEVYD
jgi:hypothetical protein